jgi:hypothetical protein
LTFSAINGNNRNIPQLSGNHKQLETVSNSNPHPKSLMKKILTLSLVLLAGLATHSKAQTFLVDLYETEGNEYTGDASTDYGISGTVTDVGGFNANMGYGDNTPDNVYTLASGGTTVGTLTLGAPYFTYNNNGAGNGQTTPYRLTGSWVADGAAGETSSTFTLDLTSLPAGDTVSIAAIGGDGGNPGTTVSVDSGTGVQINEANSDGTGTFTSLLTGGTATSYTLTSTSSNVDYTNDEGDITGILITISSSTPEPTTWALMLGGIGALVAFQGLRRRQA